MLSLWLGLGIKLDKCILTVRIKVRIKGKSRCKGMD